MQIFLRWGWLASLTTLVAVGIAACGGNDSLPPKSNVTKVYVMGDSLADAGTFGFKFTVQDASNPKGFPIWPQIVASNFGLDASAQCNAYVGVVSFDNMGDWTNESYSDNIQSSGCTNYAIGSGRIIVPTNIKNASANSANPRNIVNQFIKRAAIGNYTSTDLVLIDGGGNDAADLVGAYLKANSAEGLAAYQAFLLQQLDASTMGTLLSVPNTGPALAAGAYMQKLADTFYGQIKTQVVDKGATRVAVLNIPDITLTPRFRMVLAGVTQQADAATSAALQVAIQQWIGAFNAKLQANIGNDSRVALVDFYTDFGDQVKNPASYALSNASDASCPVTGLGSDGIPSYTFPTCTSAALDALPGKTAGWWKSYAFSDGFHPTPISHSLLAASVSRALARAGWL